jgi:uncharacterized delta-60 repeat protein
MKQLTVAVLASFTLASYAHAECPGDFDPTFGDGGIVRQALPSGLAGGTGEAVVAPDGSVFVAGWVRANPAFSPEVIVLRFTADGELDETFGEQGFASTVGSGIPTGIALQEDGKIVVSYSELDPGQTDPFNSGIVRLEEDGSTDVEFAVGGLARLVRGPKMYSRDLAVRDDGTIVLVGQEQDSLFSWQAFVYFFNPDGDLEDAVHILEDANAVATGVVPLEGNAVAVGGTILADIDDATYVAKLTADGTYDGSFADGGVRRFGPAGVSEETWRIAADGDGRIYTAGNSAPNHFERRRVRIVVRRVLEDGSVDSSFGSNGRSVTRFQRRIAPRGLGVSASGQAVVSAFFFNSLRGSVLVRLAPDGTREPSFGNNGLLRLKAGEPQILRVHVADDGRIVANGIDGETGSEMLLRLEGGTWDGEGACVVGCGDGVKRPREQCDDGNTINGDGCSAACLIE